jgi:hypothetical protein|tara:strand:- start:856 stop:1158 length:303 start_codon:yes stop_codon:yes gene_type:complete
MDFGVSIMKEAKSNGEVYLMSVGCVLDSSNAMVYPMLADGSTDLLDEGVSLRHVTEEWVDALSEEDVVKIGEVVDNLNMNIVDDPEYLKDGILGSVLELK